MQKSLLEILILSIILSFACINSVSAANVYNGTDQNTHDDINNIISNNMVEGDVLFFKNGTYNGITGSINVGKSINITAGRGGVLISKPGSRSMSCFYITTPNVNINNLNITNYDRGVRVGIGVPGIATLDLANNATLKNLVITNCNIGIEKFAVYSYSDSNTSPRKISILNLTISNCIVGISFNLYKNYLQLSRALFMDNMDTQLIVQQINIINNDLGINLTYYTESQGLGIITVTDLIHYNRFYNNAEHISQTHPPYPFLLSKYMDFLDNNWWGQNIPPEYNFAGIKTWFVSNLTLNRTTINQGESVNFEYTFDLFNNSTKIINYYNNIFYQNLRLNLLL
ncbi:hypothetical protein ALNOE001_05280 [Candidatus Methanobinarius endosymbioticus]|uniref:Uncharacterized protein n=1 Tax=Candidatus Methanobinarius endosymbioticus TaxID=2006182 RepID=A0A366MCL9_9EURY|nr:hypothetical protein ALNOE001_05280 [Candidatus Methanobinarius endosymbioticus]